MDEKKIAMDRYELHQLEVTKKSKRHFYILLILNILLAIPTVFEPGYMLGGIITLVVSFMLSALLFLGVKHISKVWVALAAVQMVYYFFNLGIVLSTEYPMSWFFLMCARCAFCLYSGWAFVLNYDIQEVVRERERHFFKKYE